MHEGRWTTITPSQFAHEREALAYVQALLPDTEPYRAWSNFTFTAQTGHPHEVDLLVAAPGGLYLIEIKSLNGRLASSGSNWILSNHGGTRVFDNPLHLADSKAKKLKSLLQAAAGQRKGAPIRIPFVQAAVFLAKPGLRVELSEHHLHGIYGPEPAPDHQPGPLPAIGALLQRPPQDEKHRVTREMSAALPDLLHAVGIARSRKHYQIGSWELESRPFDLGPTWQDHHARHRELAREHRRIRIYLVERNAVQTERASIERAAKREMLALHNINHPGIVRVDSMESHEAGPALIFRHDPRSVRLDHYLTQYGPRLDALSRLAMIRQLSEAVAYAHRRRLHHCALSARSVLVGPGPSRRGGTEEEAWLTPQLQISDWQTATRAADTAGASSGDPLTLSTHAASHIERSAEAYLAPELTTPRQDPVAMDVFGLGALAYLILTDEPPATKRAELLARLARDNGLRASAVADGISEFADELIQAATAPIPAQRLTTVADFVEMLEEVENELTAPQSTTSEHPEPEPVDPLEARGGERVGEWTVKRRLGTGSTCRAFLAHNERTGKDEVLKVGLSDEKAARLAHEARVLAPLTDSRVIRLARPEPLRIGNRTVVVLEHAGELTLARKLRDDGRLTVDELETYSDYLFGALDYLEGEGVYHRDIKPDNIAIRIRPNRTRQLVLFDFSLAGVSVKEISAGTQRYLDPFLGSANRPSYDKHAEWYALAVTLHEMASGELPVWGDGGTEPQLTEGPPVLAVEAFDPAIRDELLDFLHQALHRDHRQRFASLKDMRDAWQQVFRRSDASAPVGTDHPEITDDEPDEKAAEAARDEAAGKATRPTVLEAAGLTPRAVSAAHRLEATTVGELLMVANKLAHLPGLGARTRQELQRRVKEWRTRLGERETIPTSATARKEATAEVATETAADTGDTDLVPRRPRRDRHPARPGEDRPQRRRGGGHPPAAEPARRHRQPAAAATLAAAAAGRRRRRRYLRPDRADPRQTAQAVARPAGRQQCAYPDHRAVARRRPGDGRGRVGHGPVDQPWVGTHRGRAADGGGGRRGAGRRGNRCARRRAASAAAPARTRRRGRQGEPAWGPAARRAGGRRGGRPGHPGRAGSARLRRRARQGRRQAGGQRGAAQPGDGAAYPRDRHRARRCGRGDRRPASGAARRGRLGAGRRHRAAGAVPARP